MIVVQTSPQITTPIITTVMEDADEKPRFLSQLVGDISNTVVKVAMRNGPKILRAA